MRLVFDCMFMQFYVYIYNVCKFLFGSFSLFVVIVICFVCFVSRFVF